MKARVVSRFYDVKGGVLRRPGDVLDATAARIAEIEKALPGYIEREEAEKKAGRAAGQKRAKQD